MLIRNPGILFHLILSNEHFIQKDNAPHQLFAERPLAFHPHGFQADGQNGAGERIPCRAMPSQPFEGLHRQFG